MSGTCRELTEQEAKWAGEFGDLYTQDNRKESLLISNHCLFARIFKRKIASLIEFGANIGLNLQVIQKLLPDTQLAAVEINKNAVQELQQFIPEVYHTSLFDFQPEKTYEMTLIKGVLIHVNPDYLKVAYEKLYQTSSRYILLAEYFSRHPVEISYRGYDKLLFKRDFAGEMLDLYPDLDLVDYGFVYHRDLLAPQDDLTWFLMEKR